MMTSGWRRWGANLWDVSVCKIQYVETKTYIFFAVIVASFKVSSLDFLKWAGLGNSKRAFVYSPEPIPTRTIKPLDILEMTWSSTVHPLRKSEDYTMPTLLRVPVTEAEATRWMTARILGLGGWWRLVVDGGGCACLHLSYFDHDQSKRDVRNCRFRNQSWWNPTGNVFETRTQGMSPILSDLPTTYKLI